MEPAPLFTTSSDGWVPGPSLDVNREWEEEQHVEDSLPATPVDADVGFAWPTSGPGDGRRGTAPSADSLEQGSNQTPSPDIHPTSNETQDTLDPTDGGGGDLDIPRSPPARAPAEDEDEDQEKTCRICFSGAEEEEAMGRMISPCLCTGSMRYVHVNCLNAWRGTGSNAKAHMECPQCHYRYQLRRTLVSGLATSRPILLLSTFLSFSLLTLILGQSLHLVLHHSPTVSRALLARSGSPITSVFDLLDDPFGAGGGVIIVGGGGSLTYDILVSAIRTFVDISDSFAASRNRFAAALPGPLAGVAFELGSRFLLGLAVLGSMSFMSLLLSLSLFGPLQLMNGLRGAGFLGNWGRRRTRGTAAAAAAGGGGTSIGTIMIVLLVVVGAINTLIKVYHTVESLTGRLLRYVETQILEVNADEIRAAKRQREKERRATRWYKRWIREKRYRTRIGWYEVWVRAKFALVRWVETITGRVGEGHEE